MRADFRTECVRDLLSAGVLWVEDGNHGENRPLSDEFAPEGTPFVRPDDLKHGSVDFANCDRVNAKALQRIRKGKGRAGDIAFTHRATVGRMARVGPSAPDFVANPGVTLWRVLDRMTLDPDFLYYFMQTPFFMNQVWAEAGNTDTFPYISLTQQRGLAIRYPSISAQRAIGSTLSSLDDRIALLRETNATLEAIAQALFKSWFVDFDPVRAKSQGLAPAGMDEATAALFPDGFEESALGPVPRGWAISPLGNQCELAWGNTTITKKSYVQQGVRAYSAAGQDGYVKNAERHGIGTVISAIGTVGKVHLAYGDWTAIKNTLVAQCSSDEESTYLHFLLRTIHFPARGSTQQFISQGDARAVAVLSPPTSLRLAYGEFVLPLLSRLMAGLGQVETLTALRDLLLPRLISGQLRLPEADAIMEDNL